MNWFDTKKRQYTLKKECLNENWPLLDQLYKYNFRKDRLKIARKMGYHYISEASVKLYRQLKSLSYTARFLGVTNWALKRELKIFGIELNEPGGWNRGMTYKGTPSHVFYEQMMEKRLNKNWKVLING